MPTYVYEVITGDDDDEGQIFEVVQRMTDPPLTHHPTTGQPVRRVITPPNVSTRYSDSMQKKQLSNENLSRLGFTKYQRDSSGEYYKTAGEGPSTIKKPQD